MSTHSEFTKQLYTEKVAHVHKPIIIYGVQAKANKLLNGPIYNIVTTCSRAEVHRDHPKLQQLA